MFMTIVNTTKENDPNMTPVDYIICWANSLKYNAKSSMAPGVNFNTFDPVNGKRPRPDLPSVSIDREPFQPGIEITAVNEFTGDRFSVQIDRETFEKIARDVLQR